MNKVDLILHPLRLRILRALSGRQMSAQQLARAMPDVAQATLYRHINKLAEGGVLTLVEEKQVRGTTEKVYSLEERMAYLSAEEIAHLSKEEHLRMFTVFVTTLLNDFQRYLEHSEQVDFAVDGAGYQQIPLYMDDEELARFSTELGQAMLPYLKPKAGRKRRIFTTIAIPDPVDGDE